MHLSAASTHMSVVGEVISSNLLIVASDERQFSSLRL
jgi:hypothetical protein